MSYIYKLCFVCSTQIKGFFELNPSDPRQRTSAGTLCEILAIPLRDTTFTFGAKFQQVPFCPKCAIQMREFDKILKDLKELEEKIEKGKIEVEERLRASCLKRRSEGHEGPANDDPLTLHPIDYFREAVVSELKCGKFGSPASGNRTIPTPRSGSSLKRASTSTGRRPGPASKTIKLRSTIKPEASVRIQGGAGDESSNQTGDCGDPVANALLSILSDIDDVQNSAIESGANEGDGVEMNEGPPDSDPDYVEEEEEVEEDISKESPLKCKQCSIQFPSNQKSKLLQHVRDAHLARSTSGSKKVFKPLCSACNIEFESLADLKVHKVNNCSFSWAPGLLPQECPECGKYVTSTSNLNRHVRRKHNIDTRKKGAKC